MSDPVPPAAIVQAAWREGRLAFPCTAEGTPVWPPRIAAPGTGAPLTWRDSAGLGTVYATTALHAPDTPPRNLALIDLDEGFRMMSRVEDIPSDEVKLGMRVKMRMHPGGEKTPPYPVFVPVEGAK